MQQKIYVGQPGLMLLEGACALLDDSFGPCYAVGEALNQRSYRHVDVRMILPAERFAELFGGTYEQGSRTVRWNVMCSALTMYLQRASGLPIDFQIQSTFWSVTRYPHTRRERLGHLIGGRD
jgi:hypothetical protein